MEPGFYLIELRRKHTPCERAKRKTRKRAHPRPFRKRDGPADGPLLDISNRHTVFGVLFRNLDGPPADFQPGGERVESDVHVFFRDAGNVEFGGDLSGQKRGSKCRLAERVDRCDSLTLVPSGESLNSTLAQKAVRVIHCPGDRGCGGLTSIAASSRRVLERERALAPPAARRVPKASL